MSTIFDVLEEEATFSPETNGTTSQNEANDQVQEWYKSIPLDALKGIVETILNTGQMFGPLQGEEENITPQLDKLIPTDTTFVGSGLRRGLRQAGPAIANPYGSVGSTLIGSIVGGFAGEAGKEAGLGELSQTALEIAPFFLGGGGTTSPESFKKSTSVSETLSQSRLVPERLRNFFGKRAASQNEVNELVDFAISKGFTAEELAPLLQGETKKAVLSKFAQRGGATEGKLSRSKQSIDRVADSFKTGEFADVVLSESASSKMIRELQDILYDMPAKTRNVILEDFNQLANSPKDTKSIIKFFRDIGAQYGEHKKQLGRLKDPLKDALSTISPKLANEFNLTNKLYQKWYDISSKLKPSVASQIIEYSAYPRALFGMVTGNYPLLIESLGEVAAKKVSSELLTNPRFQQLSKKMINALNKRNFVLADKIKDEYIRTLKKDYPEVASELQKETFKEFAEIDIEED